MDTIAFITVIAASVVVLFLSASAFAIGVKNLDILKSIQVRTNNMSRMVYGLREDIAKGDAHLAPQDFKIFYMDNEPIAVYGVVDGKEFRAALKSDTVQYATVELVEE